MITADIHVKVVQGKYVGFEMILRHSAVIEKEWEDLIAFADASRVCLGPLEAHKDGTFRMVAQVPR